MKCDDREVPGPLNGADHAGWWLAGAASYFGHLAAREPDAHAEIKVGMVEGTGAMIICQGRLMGILSPPSDTRVAVWWSWPLSSLVVEATGEQGVFKKRPVAVQLHRAGGVEGDGETVILKHVHRLRRRAGRAESSHEAELVAALTEERERAAAAAAAPEAYAPAPPPHATPPPHAVPPATASPPLTALPPPTAIDVSGVGSDELAAVHSFLERRSTLAPEVRAALARQFASALWPKVRGVPNGIPAESFLEQLAQQAAALHTALR